jgi:hypothetical protein
MASPGARASRPGLRLAVGLCDNTGGGAWARKEENYDPVKFGQKRLRGDRALRL